MTSVERVLKTIKFEKPDRYPIMHSPGGINKLLENPQALIDLYKKFPGDYRYPDSVSLPIRDSEHYREDGSYYKIEKDEWGCVREYRIEGINGIVKEHPLSNWSKLDSYEMPVPFSSKPESIKKRKEKSEKIKGIYPRGASPGTQLFQRMQALRGYENLLIDIGERRKEVEILADRMLDEYMLPSLKAKLEIGADIAGMEDDWGTQEALMINPKDWRRIFKPRYKRIFSLSHEYGACFCMHSDGQILEIIPDLIEIGLDAINPQFSCMDLNKLRDLTYGKITIITDIDRQRLLLKATPMEVKEEVKRVISILGHPDGGLILRGCIDQDIPIENIRAMLEAFYE